VLASLLGAALSFFKTQRELALENLALRHQIGVLKRTLGTRRVCLKPSDRKLWVVLSRVWTGWQQLLAIVQPATVIRWHREGFRHFWTQKSRRRNGRPESEREVRALTRKMSTSNPTWGAPRIRNELAKIGIKVSTINRGQVYGPASQAALTDLALVSGQSRQRLGFTRLLCRPNRHIPSPIRLTHPRT